MSVTPGSDRGIPGRNRVIDEPAAYGYVRRAMEYGLPLQVWQVSTALAPQLGLSLASDWRARRALPSDIRDA